VHRSASTINADVAHDSRGATGRGVVVAILSTGIDAQHPHFRLHGNLAVPPGLEHQDLVGERHDEALVDKSGIGTAMASVVAGEYAPPHGTVGLERVADPVDLRSSSWEPLPVKRMAGMAPQATLLSMRVLDDQGTGPVTTIIRALESVDALNASGTRLRVHVVLLALGYEYDAALFACGQSPLCVAAARLVRSGVVVVAASGNTGYGHVQTLARNTGTALPYSINDPGNAEPVLTVGSTHRDLPEVYGVSYFSSRGPTHDGRPKPDLLAPGERILSAATGRRLEAAAAVYPDTGAAYVEDSGTSYAAAHAAGAVAQILSVRRRLRGRPDEVKGLLMATAQDLGRVREVQGAGLVDVMAALDSSRDLPVAAALPHGTPRKQPDISVAVSQDALVRERADTQRARGETDGPISLMFCYSHQDEVLLDELKTHLSPLRRQGRVDIWWDRRISPGTDWHQQILENLSAADVIVLLVSASFVDSDYAYDVELQQAVERHHAGEARVVPVMIRPVDFAGTPFENIQALPKNAKPVTSWSSTDEAWFDVARGIRRVVEELGAARSGTSG
jgi:serine protease AprX